MGKNKKILNRIMMLMVVLSLLTITACQNNQNDTSQNQQVASVEKSVGKQNELTEQQKVFREFWELYDRYYPSFNRKGINWQSIYDQYYPKITEKTSDEELFKIFKEIMATINDGHSHLEFKKKVAEATDELNPQVVNMIEKNRASKINLEESSIENPYISYGTLTDNANIGYIHSKRFEPMSEEDKEFKQFKKIVDEALENLKDKQGIVIDIRDNGGGQTPYALYLAGRFLNNGPLEFCRQRYKIANGSAESAFSQWVTKDYQGVKDDRAEEGIIGSLEPAELATINLSGDFQYTKPVVVLTSKGSASAAEFFVLAMKTQPNISSVGNTTFGIFSGSERITLKNGNGKWVTNISVQDVEIMYKGSYRNFEGKGVEPDYLILPTEAEANEGRDIHIEKAIQLLSSNTNKVSQDSELSVRTEISKDLKGYKVAFASSSENGSNNIWIANVDGSGEKQLTSGKGVDMYPEWAGDGQSIYYTSNKHGGTLELYKVNTTGEPKAKQLSLFGKEVRSLSVSADNSMITMGIMSDSVPFGEDLKPYSADLFVIKMDKVERILNEGRLLSLDDLTLLLSEPQENHIWYEQPCFQKNNTKNPYIAYVRTENYDDDLKMKDSIWVIKSDGTENKIIAEKCSMPQWAFDDKYIVTHEFQVIDPNTNEIKQLKIDGLSSEAGSASISPDGKYVMFEMSDKDRKAGMAKVIFKGSKTPNPIMKFSDRGAFEPRWSPVPIEE